MGVHGGSISGSHQDIVWWIRANSCYIDHRRLLADRRQTDATAGQRFGYFFFMRQARGGHFMDGKTRERKRDKLHQFIIRIRGYRRQVAILIERSEGEFAGCLYSGADPLQNVCCIPVY